MLKMLNTFRFYAIMPVVVFDGRKLKEKEKTHEKRTKNKDACAKIAYEYLEKGNTEMARKYFMKGISINRKMINTAVDLIKSLGVECMVAPYEADA